VTEFLSEQAIQIWGPFAFCVILLLAIVVILWRQNQASQKAYEEKDERRTTVFMTAVNQFIETASEMKSAVQENNVLLRDVHSTMIKMNERV